MITTQHLFIGEPIESDIDTYWDSIVFNDYYDRYLSGDGCNGAADTIERDGDSIAWDTEFPLSFMERGSICAMYLGGGVYLCL